MTNHHLPFSIIACHGSDARDFLHNQLTQSVNDLPADQARVFAYCTPQGRVMADGIYWCHPKEPDAIYLMLHQSIAEKFLRRLQMYVLRAKVTLELLENTTVVGCNSPVLDAQPDEQPAAADWQLPLQWQNNTLSIQAAGTQDQPDRYWLIDLAGNEENKLEIEPQQLINAETWLFQEIINGWVWINEQNTETFIPQNINLDILPAVNFSKGCFPGQEVVARSHYRATIRRRAVLAKLEPMPELNNECFSSVDLVMQPEEGKEPRIAGRIANAVKANDALWLLAETNLDFILEETPLYIANHLDNAITIEKLPFQKQLPWEKKK